MEYGPDGDRAVVAAASEGLGRAIAQEFVDRGVTVAINSRTRANLEAAKEEHVGSLSLGRGATRRSSWRRSPSSTPTPSASSPGPPSRSTAAGRAV